MGERDCCRCFDSSYGMGDSIVSVKPEFGVNYDVGYVGFTYTDKSFISVGVAWFTRWTKGGDVPHLPISHALVVTGDGQCVEAHIPKVRRTALSVYFDDPHSHIVFRKPVGWTPEMGKAIAAAAEKRVDVPYGTALIAGHLLANSFLGKFLGVVTGGRSSRFFERLFESKRQLICSELAATCLREQPALAHLGLLDQKQSFEIDPQMLFQDDKLFVPWKDGVKGELSNSPTTGDAKS